VVVTEFTLWAARLIVLVLMYGFLLALIIALVADARAASAPRPAAPAPVVPPQRPAPAPASPLVLVVTAGTPPITGHEYRLLGPLVIGRDTSCDISIPSHFISKRHARIHQVGGQWIAEDLGSTNGSVLNDEPLTAPHPLKPGDRLTVGDTEFLLK